MSFSVLHSAICGASCSLASRISVIDPNSHGASAVETLAGTDRLCTAPGATDLIADMVHDRHHYRTVAAITGGAPSRMAAEHRATRRLLNTAAQDLLRADETISGPGVRIGGETIFRGDEIVTRTQNRTATSENENSSRPCRWKR